MCERGGRPQKSSIAQAVDGLNTPLMLDLWDHTACLHTFDTNGIDGVSDEVRTVPYSSHELLKHGSRIYVRVKVVGATSSEGILVSLCLYVGGQYCLRIELFLRLSAILLSITRCIGVYVKQNTSNVRTYVLLLARYGRPCHRLILTNYL